MWEGAGYRMLSKGRAGENDQVSAQWNVRSRSLETVLEDVKCTAYNRYLWLVLPFAGFTAFDCLEWSSASCGKPRQILLDLPEKLASGERPATNSQLGKKIPGSLATICDSIQRAVSCNNISRLLALILWRR